MRMNDDELKHILKEGMEYEADQIMDEVNSDPAMKDVVAPEGLYEDIMKQIHEYEDEKEKNRENQTKEEQELIRLGRIYRRKRSRRKYYVLVAAALCALAVGTISLGDGKKVFTEMQRMLGDREQKVVNSGDGDRHIARGDVSEEEAYEEIEEKFGFYPIKLDYLPEGMEFVESIIEEDLQLAQMFYSDKNTCTVLYRVSLDYRSGSLNADVEDELVCEYDKHIEKVDVVIKEYKIKGNGASKWLIDYVYEDAYYTLVITGFEYEEIEKMIENLYFL